jgi:hypothetical protein
VQGTDFPGHVAAVRKKLARGYPLEGASQASSAKQAA